ncbi:MAG: proteasome-activating nucleotidase [Promethearchaeota archaeon]
MTQDAEVRKLRKQLMDLLAEKESLERELKKIRLELERVKYKQQRFTPPLLLANISRIVDKNYVVIHLTSGNDFLVNKPIFDEVHPGDVVAVDQQTLRIIRVLDSNIDAYVAGMELISKPEETYSDIGGLDDIIQEVREVIELPLLQPKLFKDLGIKPPKGVLLEGPPGTGKTLIARAAAHATNANFIRLVGSELIQKYIGEGARIVRELFALAREKAPSIVFIDEIDAVASRRTPDSQVSDREVQRTLMQLLAELDGFKPLDNVKIIAATNRPDILDVAILRPGRFDRIIKVPPPDAQGRFEIFKIHTRTMPLAKDVDLKNLANRWDNLTGADIKAICMEAGMFALRARRKKITMSDFLSAYKKFEKARNLHPETAPVYS